QSIAPIFRGRKWPPHQPGKGGLMSKSATVALALIVGLAAGIPLGTRVMPQQRPDDEGGAVSTGFAAVPGEIGAEDVSGAYTAADWPKNLSTLPGHEKWTWGAA